MRHTRSHVGHFFSAERIGYRRDRSAAGLWRLLALLHGAPCGRTSKAWWNRLLASGHRWSGMFDSCEATSDLPRLSVCVVEGFLWRGGPTRSNRGRFRFRLDRCHSSTRNPRIRTGCLRTRASPAGDCRRGSGLDARPHSRQRRCARRRSPFPSPDAEWRKPPSQWRVDRSDEPSEGFGRPRSRGPPSPAAT